MSALRFIEIDGKRYLWRDILELHHEQKKAHARPPQPALFELIELKDDYRPSNERSAASRYLEPSLFT